MNTVSALKNIADRVKTYFGDNRFLSAFPLLYGKIPKNKKWMEKIDVEDILRVCKGEGPTFGIKDMQQIFKPQWEYQKIAKDKKLISDSEQINRFLMYGSNPTAKVMEERIKANGF
jgi:hypothetical protein